MSKILIEIDTDDATGHIIRGGTRRNLTDISFECHTPVVNDVVEMDKRRDGMVVKKHSGEMFISIHGKLRR